MPIDSEVGGCSSGAEATVQRLLQQEEDSRVSDADNSVVTGTSAGSDDGTNAWREKVVHWIYQVVDHFNEDRESVFVAMNILDRFLSVVQSSGSGADGSQEDGDEEPLSKTYLTDSRSYEVAVMTSLLIAMKIQGNSSLDIYDFIKMSRSSIQVSDMVETGKHIVRSLSWNCQVPTPARFTHALVQLLPTTMEQEVRASILNTAVYQIELSLFDTYLSQLTPSQLAWMALENAMDRLDMDTTSHSTTDRRHIISQADRDTFHDTISRLTGVDQIDPIMKHRLLEMYQNSESSSTTSAAAPQNQEHDAAHANLDAQVQIQAQAPSHPSAPTIIPPDEDDHDAIYHHHSILKQDQHHTTMSTTHMNMPSTNIILDTVPEEVSSPPTQAREWSKRRLLCTEQDLDTGVDQDDSEDEATITSSTITTSTSTTSFTSSTSTSSLSCQSPSKRSRTN